MEPATPAPLKPTRPRTPPMAPPPAPPRLNAAGALAVRRAAPDALSEASPERCQERAPAHISAPHSAEIARAPRPTAEAAAAEATTTQPASRRRSRRPAWIVASLLTLSIGAASVAHFAPRDAGWVVVVFAPWVDAGEGERRIARAGAWPMRFETGALRLGAIAADGRVRSALRDQGALMLIDGPRLRRATERLGPIGRWVLRVAN